MAKINVEDIIERLQTKSEKGPVSLYLNKDMFERFLVACETLEVSASGTVEDFMKQFLDSALELIPTDMYEYNLKQKRNGEKTRKTKKVSKKSSKGSKKA